MNKLVQRVINILKSPKSEWPVIAAEPATPASIYMPYVLLLAAIGPVALLIGGGDYGFFQLSGGMLLRSAIAQYVSALIGVALFALVIHFLAPTFGGTRNYTQALKSAAYAMTASYLAGIGSVVGLGLGTLIALAGMIYSIYLLYLSLPHTMKAPPEKATAYTVVTILACIVVGVLLAIFTRSLGMGSAMSPMSREDVPTFDPDSPLGRLEQAGRAMEQAQRDGAQTGAVDPGAALGAALGAMAGAQGAVEALPSDTLKAFLPETLGGLPRQSVEAERNAMMGLQVSRAAAEFREDGRTVDLEITDTGGAAGLMAFAGWAQLEGTREEGTRTERTAREDGRVIHEQWDSADGDGEYTMIVGNRFVVKVEGEARSLADLKALLGEVDIARLESLRDQGVPAAR